MSAEAHWNTIPLEVPPGFFRGGTKLASRGRWYDGNLVRWYDGIMEPIGGEAIINGRRIGGDRIANDAHAWVGRDGSPLLAFGSGNWAAVYRGDSPGAPDRIVLDALPVLANTDTWSMDNFGGDLIGCRFGQEPFIVDTSQSNLAAASIGMRLDDGSLFPLARGVVATPERFVMAYGITDEPNRIIWSTQGLYGSDGNPDWSPSLGDSAGGTYIGMRGKVLAGRRARRETLFWTTAELISAQYITQPYLYRFDIVGECSCISRRAMVVKGSEAFWMGKRNFWMYSGAVRRLPCEVAQLVFSELNRDAGDKVWCERRDQFGEIIWHYPSGNSTSCNRYVIFNYDLGIWYFGDSPMQAGVDAGVHGFPYAVADNGDFYRMESGNSYRGATRVPFAITGVLDLHEGRQQMMVDTIFPDEQTQGGIAFALSISDSVRGAYTQHGPWFGNQIIEPRVMGKYLQLSIQQTSEGSWRFGLPRLRMQGAGYR